MIGHVRRRGKRSFELKFDVGTDPVTGRRRIRYKNFKGTKREADIELSRLVLENAAGNGIDPSKETLTEFTERWDRDWASVNVSLKTLDRYRGIIKLYVVPHIGAVRMQKLRAVHLQELYAKLLRGGGRNGRPLSPASVCGAHRLLHRALGHAATWGIVAQNVATLVKPPPIPDSDTTILTEGEISAVLRYLSGRTLRPIVSFLIGTGARRGEALALRWQDLDLEKRIVRIERSLEQSKSGLRFKSPKTKRGRRNVAISPWLVAELRAHRARQQKQRLALGLGRAAADSLVFATWDGSPRAPRGLSQKFTLAMASLKIEGVTLHSLRHTHVSQLIASGMDVLTISRRIGHASPATTLNRYGHLFTNTDARAAEIMEATFARMQTE